MDVHDRATRSYNMSQIHSRDTRPEVRLRQLLWTRGLRGYRLHQRLPGKPDIIFSRARLVIFIDGCFWHGCPKCGDGHAPASNTSYWSVKLRMNRERDKRRTRELQSLGWTVLRLWEHEIFKKSEQCLRRIERLLTVS